MSTRAQVRVVGKGCDVYLYQHCDGFEVIDKVRKALLRKERWISPEYLARMIFCEMVKDAIDEYTGYGIGSKEHWDIDCLVTVDCREQAVIVNAKHSNELEALSFEDFIQKGE